MKHKPKMVLRFFIQRDIDVFAMAPNGMRIRIGICRDPVSGLGSPRMDDWIKRYVAKQCGVSMATVVSVAKGKTEDERICAALADLSPQVCTWRGR